MCRVNKADMANNRNEKFKNNAASIKAPFFFLTLALIFLFTTCA
jgi:hypothetical protein